MIDPQIQKQLRERFNPDGSELRNIQLQQLELLKFFDEFCQRNHIKYWLSSGTCLGAVRHGGFIPWDDDIDVEMMREDYVRFCRLWKDTSKYSLQNRLSDKFYILAFSKIRINDTEYNESDPISRHYKFQGIFIDVFCMEPISRFCGRTGDYMAYHLSNLLKSPEPSIIQRSLFLIGKNILYITAAIIRPFQKLFVKDEVCHAFGSCNYIKSRKKSHIFPLSKANFEGFDVPIPGNVDAYLTRMFGDYNKLPNIGSHDFKIHRSI